MTEEQKIESETEELTNNQKLMQKEYEEMVRNSLPNYDVGALEAAHVEVEKLIKDLNVVFEKFKLIPNYKAEVKLEESVAIKTMPRLNFQGMKLTIETFVTGYDKDGKNGRLDSKELKMFQQKWHDVIEQTVSKGN